MNNDTDKILSAANAETQTISIVDPTLRIGDMEVIARKIKECRNLQSLSITGSGLTQEMMEPVIDPIRQHPSLTKLDLRDNNFVDLYFIERLLTDSDYHYGNPRIRELYLLPNKGTTSHRVGVNFFSAAFAKDDLVVLHTDIDPWNSKDGVTFSLFDPNKTLLDSLNLLELLCSEKWRSTYRDSWDSEYNGDARKRKFVSEICERNKTEATRLLGRVEKATTITSADIDAVSKRLPSILYLGEKAHGREWIQSALRGFYANAKKQLGNQVDMARFKSYVPDPIVVVPVVPVYVAPVVQPNGPSVIEKTRDISTILAGLSKTDEDTIRRQIGDALDHPNKMQELGKTEVKTAADLAVAALHVMTSMPTLETAEGALRNFLAKLGIAQGYIEEISGETIVTALAEAKGEIFSPLVSQTPPAKGVFFRHVDTLADAGKSVGEAAQHLQEATTAMVAVAKSIAEQLDTTIIVSEAYAKIGNQINRVVDTGNKVLQEKRRELETPAKSPEEQDLRPQAELRLNLLGSRLDFLTQTRNNFRAQLGLYSVHGSLIQDANQSITSLCEQHLSLLNEEITSFATQLGNSRETGKNAAHGADSKAATQTLKAIATLTSSTLDEVNQIDGKVSRLRAHVSELFPRAALTTPLREQSPAVAGQPRP